MSEQYGYQSFIQLDKREFARTFQLVWYGLVNQPTLDQGLAAEANAVGAFAKLTLMRMVTGFASKQPVIHSTPEFLTTEIRGLLHQAILISSLTLGVSPIYQFVDSLHKDVLDYVDLIFLGNRPAWMKDTESGLLYSLCLMLAVPEIDDPAAQGDGAHGQ